MQKIYQKTIDNTIDIFFSSDKTKLYLLFIFLFGLILRIIAAFNIGVAADDMITTVQAINFLNSGKLEVYNQSSGLWYFLTDIFYRIFGATQFGSRFTAVLFGSLTIIVMFLFINEFFNKKTALFASLFVAFSSFHIKNTLAEMDIMVIFFSLFALFFFVKSLKSRSKIQLTLSGIFLGLGILTKVYTLLFIPVMLIYAGYYFHSNPKESSKRNLKFLGIFLIVVFIFCVPAITHNYLLYKDKKLMDLLFASYFIKNLGLNDTKSLEYYGWDANYNAKADFKGFFLGNSPRTGFSPTPNSILVFKWLWAADPVIFVLGLLGLIFCVQKKRSFLVMSGLIAAFVLFYIASRMPMSKHFIFLILIFAPSAGLALNIINEFVRSKFNKNLIKPLIVVIIILEIMALSSSQGMHHVFSQSSVQQFMSFKENNIQKQNSLIIADSRIYRGQINWMMNDRNYVEASLFPQVQEISEKAQGNKINYDLYFVECVIDDCGWGTIAGQPDFNSSMESFVSLIANNSRVIKDILVADNTKSAYPLFSKKTFRELRVYKTSIMLNPVAIAALNQTMVWFYYPIGYNKGIEAFDDFKTHSFIDKVLLKIAFTILYAGIVISFFSVLLAFYLIIADDSQPSKDQDNNLPGQNKLDTG